MNEERTLRDSVNEYKRWSCDSGSAVEAVNGVTWRYVVKDRRSYISISERVV